MGRVALRPPAAMDLLAATGRTFRRGGSVSALTHDQDGQLILGIIKPAAFTSYLESVAKLIAWKTSPA